MKVEKIIGIIPFTKKSIDVEVQGKNLILTGKNGCGKTQLLNVIFDLLSKAPQHHASINAYNKQIGSLKKTLEKQKSNLANISKTIDSLTVFALKKENESRRSSINSQIEQATDNKKQNEAAIENSEIRIKQIENEITSLNCYIEKKEGTVLKYTKIEYSDIQTNQLQIIITFEALRSSAFQPVQNITSMEQEDHNIRSNSQNYRPGHPGAGSFIEKFLANWEVKSALRDKKGDYTVTNDLEAWKKQLVDSLKVLLDDESTSLEFDDNALNYKIKQKDKVSFSFRDLSSGYSAILKVFSELLMQTEVSEFSPNTICGFVGIDEIDAHLHVSLQRKVLPFFTELFPNVQFIVTTHSPFVINSNDNVVVYDLSSLKTVNTNEIDLRYFTSDLITENILNVSNKSDWLNRKVEELTSTENLETLAGIVKELEGSEGILDSETLTFYFQAKRQLQKKAESN